MRPIRATVVAAACVGALASPARAQVCFAPALERELTSCGSDARVGTLRRPGRAPASLPAARERATPTTERAPELTETPDLDPFSLDASGRRRERGLLERERAVLERIVERTPARDPRRGDALERLAMTLGELLEVDERRARLLDEPIFAARGRADAPTVRRLLGQQRDAAAAARAHRGGAVRALAALVTDHPDRRALDRALYALAYHLERMRRAAQARQVYQRLIREHPSSPYVPHAYLAFAEHSFREGDLDAARQLYERVLRIPPAENPVYGYARYKLAWVRENLSDHRGALAELVRLLEHVRAHPTRAESSSLARAARRELVVPYSRVGRPERALAFFRRTACAAGVEAATCEAHALEMLEALGALYQDSGQWAESIAVHHELMAEQPASDGLCGWQVAVLDATIASRPKAEQAAEARRSLALRSAFVAAPHPGAAIAACTDRVAGALVLLSTAWHREAVGAEDAPGTRDRATMAHAAALYGWIEEALPELSALALSEIDPRDRPSAALLAFYRGELLYELSDWSACAEAYGRALDLAAEPQLSAEAAYGAVLCYDRHLGARQPPATPADRALSARALTEEEARMAVAFRRFVCAAPEHDELAVVLYRWARLHYEANQLEPASVLFRRVAMDHPRSEVGEYAANLYLDSLNMLGERRGRSACFDVLREALEPLVARYSREEAPALRAGIDGLACGLGARHAEALGRRGEHPEAARAYLDLVRDDAARCPEAPRYLYNAAIHFEAARLLGRAIRVREVLIASYPDDALARRAIHLTGGNYHALAIYPRAAELYERYVREGGSCEAAEGAPPCPDAADGLRHAVLFRLGLGQTEEAMADARAFERAFRASHPSLAAEVVFAIGAVHERSERWSALVDHYRGFLRRYAAVATPTQLAQAHVRVARGDLAQGRRDRAEPHLRAAVELHARGGEEAIGQLPGTEGDRELAAVLLRDAVAESRYELAEGARERFEAHRFPTLRGRPTLTRVEGWAASELHPWMAAKLALLDEARALYDEVAPLGIPRWQIAAASRLGDMVLGLVDQVRDSPVPDVIAQDPELYQAYVGALDDATAPYHEVAIARYEACLRTATRARWFDARSRRCEQALHRLDAARFPVASELRGAPAYRPRSAAPAAPATLDAPG